MNFYYNKININYEIFEENAYEKNKCEENNNAENNCVGNKCVENSSETLNSTVPLLILHGWMARIEAMAPIYQYFKRNRKVIVLDFPGQGGESDTLEEVWGVPEYAEMVKSLLDSLKIEKCDVIGHSFGGRIIIYLSSKYKNLFNKIVLTDAAGVKPKTSLKKLFKIYSYKIAKRIMRLTTPKEKYEEKLAEMRQKRGSSDYAMLTSNVMRETFKKVINLDLTNKLKEIEQPTLLVWGDKDTDTPLYMAKIMEKKIKDAGLVILENAGHFSYLDNPQKYLVIVETFLKNI